MTRRLNILVALLLALVGAAGPGHATFAVNGRQAYTVNGRIPVSVNGIQLTPPVEGSVSADLLGSGSAGGYGLLTASGLVFPVVTRSVPGYGAATGAGGLTVAVASPVSRGVSGGGASGKAGSLSVVGTTLTITSVSQGFTGVGSAGGYGALSVATVGAGGSTISLTGQGAHGGASLDSDYLQIISLPLDSQGVAGGAGLLTATAGAPSISNGSAALVPSGVSGGYGLVTASGLVFGSGSLSGMGGSGGTGAVTAAAQAAGTITLAGAGAGSGSGILSISAQRVAVAALSGLGASGSAGSVTANAQATGAIALVGAGSGSGGGGLSVSALHVTSPVLTGYGAAGGASSVTATGAVGYPVVALMGTGAAGGLSALSRSVVIPDPDYFSTSSEGWTLTNCTYGVDDGSGTNKAVYINYSGITQSVYDENSETWSDVDQVRTAELHKNITLTVGQTLTFRYKATAGLSIGIGYHGRGSDFPSGGGAPVLDGAWHTISLVVTEAQSATNKDIMVQAVTGYGPTGFYTGFVDDIKVTGP